MLSRQNTTDKRMTGLQRGMMQSSEGTTNRERTEKIRTFGQFCPLRSKSDLGRYGRLTYLMRTSVKWGVTLIDALSGFNSIKVRRVELDSYHNFHFSGVPIDDRMKHPITDRIRPFVV